MNEQRRHPQHDQVARAVRGWFRQPFEGMGYLSERSSFGTYWSTGMVYPDQNASVNIDAFLADLQAHFGSLDVVITFDEPQLEESMAPAMKAAGWREAESDMFLAHTGIAPKAQARPGLVLEPATEANLKVFTLTDLISFDDEEWTPDQQELAAEMDRKREELAGSGRGLLALIGGVPAGIMRWFDDPLDIWIRGLAVRPACRGQGIGSALVNKCLAGGYSTGKRSMLINVALANRGAQRLYSRLGFSDEVYRRRQFYAAPDSEF